MRLLVEMLTPYNGRIYDSACGFGGKFGDISVYDPASNATTRRLAIINLGIRGIEADVDTLRRGLRVGCVLSRLKLWNKGSLGQRFNYPPHA